MPTIPHYAIITPTTGPARYRKPLMLEVGA